MCLFVFLLLTRATNKWKVTYSLDCLLAAQSMDRYKGQKQDSIEMIDYCLKKRIPLSLWCGVSIY